MNEKKEHLTSNARWVCWSLAQLAVDEDVIEQKQDDLAKIAQVGLRTLHSSFNEILAAGLLEKEYRSAVKKTARCRYRIRSKACLINAVVGGSERRWREYASAVYADEVLKRHEKLVLLALVLRGDNSGFVEGMGLSELGLSCGMTKDRVQRYVKSLVSKSYLYQANFGATGGSLLGVMKGSYYINLRALGVNDKQQILRSWQNLFLSSGFRDLKLYLKQVLESKAMPKRDNVLQLPLKSFIPSEYLSQNYSFSDVHFSTSQSVVDLAKRIYSSISSAQVLTILQRNLERSVSRVLSDYPSNLASWEFEHAELQDIASEWKERVVPRAKLTKRKKLLERQAAASENLSDEIAEFNLDCEAIEVFSLWAACLAVYQAKCVHILCSRFIEESKGLCLIGSGMAGELRSFRLLKHTSDEVPDSVADLELKLSEGRALDSQFECCSRSLGQIERLRPPALLTRTKSDIENT